MRQLLFLLVVCFSFHVPAYSTHFTYEVDSTGATKVCVSEKFSGSVNIQEYRWNKWVNMESFLLEKVTSDTCVRGWIPLHSGENTIRLQVIPLDTLQEMFYLLSIKVSNGLPLTQDVVGGHLGNSDTLKFPRFTKWEIYDQYGTIVKQGVSDSVPLEGFAQGNYYLLYDNIVTEFLVCNHDH